MKYSVIIHKAEEGGYWAEIPALPGCVAQGETVEETVASIQRAAEGFILSLIGHGEPVPAEDAAIVREVEVAVAS